MAEPVDASVLTNLNPEVMKSYRVQASSLVLTTLHGDSPAKYSYYMKLF